MKGLCAFHYGRQYHGVAFDKPKQPRVTEPFVSPAANGGCGVLECGRPIIARGLCWNHYKRLDRGAPVFVLLGKGKGTRASALKFGPKLAPYRERREQLIRWWLAEGLVTPEPNTGCLLWTGDVYPTGYGKVGNFRDPWGGYAHRAALHFNGVKLERSHGMHARHACDQPGCVLFDHLAYGPAALNILDRDRRGRNAIATITADTARAIYAAAQRERPMDVARRFGVKAEIVRSIKCGNSWRWATGATPPPCHRKRAAA